MVHRRRSQLLLTHSTILEKPRVSKSIVRKQKQFRSEQIVEKQKFFFQKEIFRWQTNKVKSLGVWFTTDPENTVLLNYKEKLEKN